MLRSPLTPEPRDEHKEEKKPIGEGRRLEREVMEKGGLDFIYIGYAGDYTQSTYSTALKTYLSCNYQTLMCRYGGR